MYWIGHLAFMIVDNNADDDDKTPSMLWYWMYDVYNWCMTRSLAIQGPGKFGPWNRLDHEY